MSKPLQEIVADGYCIGCGACAAVEPDRFEMMLDAQGRIQARVLSPSSDEAASPAANVCPFSERSRNEDELSAELFPRPAGRHPSIGSYVACYAGRVADDAVYRRSSSGGIGRWFLTELLRLGDVDRVLHVAESNPGEDGFPLYRYHVSHDPEEVMATAKSAYYPVELSGVVRFLRENPGRYAITGVPCFIKAVRNIARIDAVVRERLACTVGIVCGHLKSTFYGEMIGWQLGVEPADLRGIDFRVKIPGKKASEKGVSALAKGASSRTPAKTVQEIFGTNYGHGYFKYKACDYCDDVLAETADISIGDAWLPEYTQSGTSIVVARTERVRDILEAAKADGRLRLEPVGPNRVADSQRGGLRHRRDGLAYRLHLKKKSGEWAPPKRVKPRRDHLKVQQRIVFRQRCRLSEESFGHFAAAKERNDWSRFERPMRRLNRRYERIYAGLLRGSLPFRAINGLRRLLKASSR